MQQKLFVCMIVLYHYIELAPLKNVTEPIN